jgi:hypothetical protein
VAGAWGEAGAGDEGERALLVSTEAAMLAEAGGVLGFERIAHDGAVTRHAVRIGAVVGLERPAICIEEPSAGRPRPGLNRQRCGRPRPGFRETAQPPRREPRQVRQNRARPLCRWVRRRPPRMWRRPSARPRSTGHRDRSSPRPFPFRDPSRPRRGCARLSGRATPRSRRRGGHFRRRSRWRDRRGAGARRRRKAASVIGKMRRAPPEFAKERVSLNPSLQIGLTAARFCRE